MEPTTTQALANTLAEIEKHYGKGAIMRLGEGATQPEVQVISTGSLGLNIALGVGGLPRGRIVEVYGPESSGKTTLTLHVLAEAQKLGGVCAFIDAEHALDIGYARRLGVKTDDLLIAQPDFGEQALDITDKLVKSGAVDVIVIDSVAALVPKAELEGDMGDSHVGLHARLMSQALRKLTSGYVCAASPTASFAPAVPACRRSSTSSTKWPCPTPPSCCRAKAELARTSDTSEGPSRAPSLRSAAASRSRTRARSSWTRSGSFHWRRTRTD
jgi:protein RecA